MIRLKKLSYKYTDSLSRALNEINCEIAQGEFVYLTGPSHSGKTTFLQLLSGQIKPDNGLISINSTTLNRLKKSKRYLLRRQVGVVLRDFELLEYKTVYENIAYVLEVIEFPEHKIEERVLEILSLVGLHYKALDAISNCSVDERRRIAIARAIVHHPKILVIDEPTDHLGVKPRINMLKLLHQINQRGMTVIMATKHYELIDHMPSRVIELEEGRIKSDRSKDHMMLILSTKMGEYYIS